MRFIDFFFLDFNLDSPILADTIFLHVRIKRRNFEYDLGYNASKENKVWKSIIDLGKRPQTHIQRT
jgi:hypothetical protein